MADATNITKPDLKPCPFCGYEAKLTQQKNTGLYYVGCKFGKRRGYACKAHIGPYSGDYNAIENWNRRPEPTEAQIEAAARAIEPLWHKFCTEPIELLLDGESHERFVQTLAKAALIAGLNHE